MSGKNLSRLFAALTLLLFFIVPLSINAQEVPKELLIEVVEPDGRVAKPLAAHESRARSVRIDYELLGGAGTGVVAEFGDVAPAGSIKLNLFEDADYIVQLSKIEPMAGRPGFIWHGSVPDAEMSQVLLSVYDGKLFGYVQVNTKVYEIQPDGEWLHRVIEIDQSGYADSPDDTLEPTTSGPISIPLNAPEDDGLIIDVMVLYSADARVGAGGTSAMESFLEAVVALTNEAYANSNITPRVRLVHTAETIYTETGNSSTDLNALISSVDGLMDEAHTLRATYGADLVALILETTSGCGRGNLYNGSSSAAFTVTLRTCALGNLTFAHELGHNMGARHDWYVDPTTGTAAGGGSDNHGRAYLPGSWRTVLSYNNYCSDQGGSCTRVAWFSNPDVDYNSVTTGFVAGTNTTCTYLNTGNPDCDADNARVLDATAATIATFATETVKQTVVSEASAASVRQSQRITYTLSITNTGTSAANGIVVTATVPAHTTLDAATLSVDAANSGTSAGSEIVWTTGSNLATGAGLTRTFAVVTNGPGLASLSAEAGSDNGVTSKSSTIDTRIVGTVGCGFYDGFEAGALSSAWSTYLTNQGRVAIGTTAANTGSYSALLDDYDNGNNYSYAAIILPLDLTGETDVQLDFDWRAFSNESHPGLEGVFLSDDHGATWSEVLSFASSPASYTPVSLDIDALAAANTLSLNDQFQIKFQEYDNFALSQDGISIDDVHIICDGVTTRTWDGGGSTNNWSEAANWSDDTIPNGDAVLFNAASGQNAIVDGLFSNNIADFTVSSGYTGVITQSNGLIATGNYYQLGGTLILDGTDPMEVNGNMIHDGGVIAQTRSVSNADVAFMNVTNAAGTTVKYRGIDLDTTATTNDLGAVTVSITAIDNV